MNKTHLCMSSYAHTHPSCLGLRETSLLQQDNLVLHSSAQTLRSLAAEADFTSDVWLVSADDMGLHNLVAGLHKVAPHLKLVVYLPSEDACSESSQRRLYYAGATSVQSYVQLHNALSYLVGDTAFDVAPLQQKTLMQDTQEEQSRALDAGLQKEAISFVDMQRFVAQSAEELWDDYDECLVAEHYLDESHAVFDGAAHLSLGANSHVGIHAQVEEPSLSESALEGDAVQSCEPHSVDSYLPVAKPSDAASNVAACGRCPQETHNVQSASGMPLDSKIAQGLLVVVSGASGGSGKTAVTAELGRLAHQRGYKVLLCDGDIQHGNLAQIAEGFTSLSLADAQRNQRALAHIAQSSDQVVISAPERFEDYEGRTQEVVDFIFQAQKYFDLVLVDAGSYLSSHYADLITQAHQVLLLIDQSPASLSKTQRFLDLCKRCGVSTQQFSYLLNHCSKKSPFAAFDVLAQLGIDDVYELADGAFGSWHNDWTPTTKSAAKQGQQLEAGLAHLAEALLPKRGARTFDMPQVKPASRFSFLRRA